MRFNKIYMFKKNIIIKNINIILVLFIVSVMIHQKNYILVLFTLGNRYQINK